ncbi:hypothetical protein [Actinomycetospora cinnamomea]|uniref:Uncharacterized protein n=1 Tax=Actinomycetospora cinnamomea TaxID=663609 RepID=A0A2U1F6Q8_9PSEU|nr:hypothetical protein [Actinomycetospora cinnamomea]PVZ07871.1 hypothetical protein C8D89_11024 [Actinomycetospora cinnamomea]
MDSFPPAQEPARHLDDLLAGLDEEDTGADPSGAPDLPEVAEAVTGRARDLHRLADRLSGDADAGTEGTTLPAVALLRAHAGAVDALAEHLLAAGTQDAPAGSPDTVHGPARDGGGATDEPRGAPRGVG